MSQPSEGTASTSASASASTPTTAQTPRRHCWECLRRRLVCDSARPVCNRCRTSGIVCPGYGEQQPLRWVKPGRVTARNRRHPKVVGDTTQVTRVAKKTAKNAGRNTDVDADSYADISSQGSSMNGDTSDEGELERKFDALTLFSLMRPKALDAIMRYDIKCDNFAGAEASYIYNIEIYERCSPLKLLHGESRYKLPTTPIGALLPQPIRNMFILFALGHQMFNLPRGVEEKVIARARSAIAFWTCESLRSLNEAIEEEKTRASDGTMTAVLMLMIAGMQMSTTSSWRFHYDGLKRMWRMRGGIEKIWKESPHMHNTIQTWVVCEAFANTTSPSDDQATALTGPKNVDFAISMWTVLPPVYVGSICPPPLFPFVVRINHLREFAAAYRNSTITDSLSSLQYLPPSSSFPTTWTPIEATIAYQGGEGGYTPPFYEDAATVLENILNFSPEGFAETNGTEETQDKWVLMARIHQSAVVLYCILSLRDVFAAAGAAPSVGEGEAWGNLELGQTLRTHYDRLMLDLKEALLHNNFRSCFHWPLVVAGVCAGVRGTAFERSFVAEQLSSCVSTMGSYMPLMARNVLKTFWESGKTGWDDCFDQPYIFVA